MKKHLIIVTLNIIGTLCIMVSPTHAHEKKPTPAAQTAAQAHEEAGIREIKTLLVHIPKGNPSVAYSLNDLGVAYMQRGNALRAKWCFTEALRLIPKSPIIQRNLAGTKFYLAHHYSLVNIRVKNSGEWKIVKNTD